MTRFFTPFRLFAGLFVCAVLTLRIATPAFSMAGSVSGAEVYQEYCAGCHEQVSPRIPPRDALQKMSAARILRTLDFGVMMSIAYPLRRDQREAVANYLGMPGPEPAPPPSSFCSDRRLRLFGNAAGSWNGWSPESSNTRFQPAANAALTIEQVRRLKLKWSYGFPGDITAFAAPTVLNGTLIVGSASGAVQALDARSGCLYWMFQADGPVRSAILAVQNGSRTSLLFGDQIGRFYSLDASTGHLLWKRRIDSHDATRLTGSPAAQGGVVFVPAASWEETRALNPQYVCCTFRGSVTALRVRDGSMVWKTYMVDPPAKRGVNSKGTDQFGPSGAGIWSAPTVDARRGLLYVATGDNYSSPATTTSDALVALELKSGRIVWTQQTTPNDVFNSACHEEGSHCGPDHDFGSSALLVHTMKGQDLIVAGQKSGMVYALNPDQKGKIVWQTRVGKGGTNGGVQWGMASDEQKIYAAVSDAVLLQSAMGAAPIGGANFDPVQGGGLTALRLEDGARIWFTAAHPCEPPRAGCSPAQSAALTAIPGVVFSGSLDGHLRAFAAEDGKVVWDFDTIKEYQTANGIHARGGSLDGAGAVIADGMLYVNSGYPRFGGTPGNVLLAFAPESKPN